MVRQDLDRFFEMVASDPALQAGLESVDDESAFVARAVRLGVTVGCKFTADDVRARLQSELSHSGVHEDVGVIGGTSADDYMLQLGCNPKCTNRTGSYVSGACITIDAQAALEIREAL